MNQDLETYLNRATRRLRGACRRRVRAELAANLHQAALDHQLRGAEPQEAMRLALRDFGSPERLHAGMHQVHTVPGVLRGLLALLALAGGAYGAARAFPTQPPAAEAQP